MKLLIIDAWVLSVRQISIDVYHQIESEGLLSKKRAEMFFKMAHKVFGSDPKWANLIKNMLICDKP